jgi:hypothetical protein
MEIKPVVWICVKFFKSSYGLKYRRGTKITQYEYELLTEEEKNNFKNIKINLEDK